MIKINKFSGSTGILKNIRFIAADLGPERGVKEECTLKEVVNFLLQRGFILEDFKYKRVCALFKNESLE